MESYLEQIDQENYHEQTIMDQQDDDLPGLIQRETVRDVTALAAAVKTLADIVEGLMERMDIIEAEVGRLRKER